MSITLTYDGETLPLDDDLYWPNENDSTSVKQDVSRSLTGALIVQTDGGPDLPGTPIDLQPEDDSSAWMIFQDVETLRAWAKVPGAVFDLVIHGETHRVMFRHEEPPALTAKKVVHFSDVQAGDFYLVTLKFITV